MISFSCKVLRCDLLVRSRHAWDCVLAALGKSSSRALPVFQFLITRSGKTRTKTRRIDEIRNTKSSNTDAFTLIPEGKRKRVRQRETGGDNGKEASGEMTQRRR